MIKTDASYRAAVERLKIDREHLEEKRRALHDGGLSVDQTQRALDAEVSFHEQLREEVEWYERARRGDVQAAASLDDIGRALIGLRIATGMTQRELAERLGVHESQVSRDERNEYYGITVQRAQEIIRALSGSVEVFVRAPERELVGA